jgi:hypothetical protein
MRLIRKGVTRHLVDATTKNNITLSLRNCEASSHIFQTKNAYYIILNLGTAQDILDIEALLSTQFNCTLGGSPYDSDNGSLLVKLPFRSRFESLFYDKFGYETGSHIMKPRGRYNIEIVFGGIWPQDKGYSWKLAKAYELP